MQALDEYSEFLSAAPAIIVGDFNSHWRWDGSSSVNHSRLVERLRDEFGLVSAYHAFHGLKPGDEQPTLFWQWKEHQPYHVDYCFIPEAWLPHVEAVEVGDFSQWAGESDHRPLMVEIAAAALSS
jgi:endonuclease/exonuclease/phosphatase family metal-dependent hydrolase